MPNNQHNEEQLQKHIEQDRKLAIDLIKALIEDAQLTVAELEKGRIVVEMDLSKTHGLRIDDVLNRMTTTTKILAMYQ